MKSKQTEGATISFEIATLAILDEYCISHRLQRSQVVEKAVRRFLASEESENLDYFEIRYNQLDLKAK